MRHMKLLFYPAQCLHPSSDCIANMPIQIKVQTIDDSLVNDTECEKVFKVRDTHAILPAGELTIAFVPQEIRDLVLLPARQLSILEKPIRYASSMMTVIILHT